MYIVFDESALCGCTYAPRGKEAFAHMAFNNIVHTPEAGVVGFL